MDPATVVVTDARAGPVLLETDPVFPSPAVPVRTLTRSRIPLAVLPPSVAVTCIAVTASPPHGEGRRTVRRTR
jgi:hypothetical protein